MLWVIINLIQGLFTEISNDEAYYWMYAQNLDWGYFDHPPMIALMIKTGYHLIPNVLGVRVVTILFSGLSLFFLFLINDKKNPIQVFVIFIAISIIQAYSFIAVPDSPMLFFAVLFYYFLQRYFKEDNWINSVGLAVVIALLLYSKYHGILIVFFTLLANFSLFKKKSFYLIVLIAIAVYSPHIYWQILNDYPSYKFHVLSKSHDPYVPLHSVLYLLGQLVVFGPLIGFIFFNYLFKNKSTNNFEKTLKVTLIGFIIFFLFSTLNSHGELNWTGVAVIPGVILFDRWLTKKPSRFFRPLAYLSIGVFLVARFHLMYSLLPVGKVKKSEFHYGELWASQIKERAENLPVVFINSYQQASKYSFYTGEIAHSMNNSRYRKNQYDLWDIEDNLQGEKVFVLKNESRLLTKELETVKKIYYAKIDTSYLSFSKINFEINEKKIISPIDSSYQLKVTMSNGYHNPIDFSLFERNIDLHYEILKDGKFLYTTKTFSLKGIVLEDQTTFDIAIKSPSKKGKCYMKLVINSGDYGPFINSRFIPLVVE